MLRMRMSEGAAVIVATNRLDILMEFDWVVLLKDCQIRHSGKVADLAKHAKETVFVETENQAAVKAIGRPFEISAEEIDGGLLLKTASGQELAARLLLEGYGDVKTVLLTPRRPADVLKALINGH